MSNNNKQTNFTACNATPSSTRASKEDSPYDYLFKPEDAETRGSTLNALRSSLQEAMHKAQKAGTWVPSVAAMANVRIGTFRFDNLELDARAGCIAYLIEKALYEAYSNSKPYYDQARMLFYHLREKQILCDSLLVGNLDPRVLAIMTVTQLRNFENGDRAAISFMGKFIRVGKPAVTDAASTSSPEVVLTDVELVLEQMQQQR